MINILVVEDEPPIQRMICRTISGMDPEFRVAFTAFNGVEAQRILETETIDVVFTDIMMIGGDGITLLQYLHDNRPEIQTVVLSGYDKFEYARQAYKNGVMDYLLKPVNKDELRGILCVLKEQHHLRMRELRRECFRNILEGREGKETGGVCAELFQEAWHLLLIRVSGRGGERKEQPILLEEMIESEIVGILGKEDTVFLAADGAGEYITAVRDKKAGIDPLIMQFLNVMEKYKRVIAVAGVAKSCKAGEFSQRLLELRIQIMTESIFGNSCYSCNGQSWPDHDDTWEGEVRSEGFSQMIKAMKVGDTDSVCHQMDIFLEKFKQSNKTCMAIENFLMELMDKGPGNRHSVRASVWNAVYETFSYDELRDRLFRLIKGLGRQEDTSAESGEEVAMPRMVIMIERYLMDNYQRNIKAGELSMEFGFVSEYISRTFKKYVGLSPTRYLTKIRMEKACELIRNCPDMQIKEVADQVGYKDIHYFSKVFRKEMGVWPSEYK